MKNVLKLLAKNLLMLLGLTAAASATDTGIQNKMFESDMTMLLISNEELNDIIKIVKYLKEFYFLINDVSETIQNEAKEQKDN